MAHGGDLSRTGSEESIINPKAYVAEGITKTTQVSVTLDNYSQETTKSML